WVRGVRGSVALGALDALDVSDGLDSLHGLDALVICRRVVQGRVLVHDWRGAGAGAHVGQGDLRAGAGRPILDLRAGGHDAAAEVAVDRMHRHLPRVTGAGGARQYNSLLYRV